MTFEIYTRAAGQNLGVDQEPKVSLRKSGVLAFSGGASRQLGLPKGKEIVLLFDAATGQIGVRTCRSGDHSSAKLTVTNNGQRSPNAALQVSFVGYLKRFPIDASRVPGIYPLCADERTGLAIVQLPAGSWQRELYSMPVRDRMNGKRGTG